MRLHEDVFTSTLLQGSTQAVRYMYPAVALTMVRLCVAACSVCRNGVIGHACVLTWAAQALLLSHGTLEWLQCNGGTPHAVVQSEPVELQLSCLEM